METFVPALRIGIPRDPLLTFDEPTHRYRHGERELIGVTAALDAAGLIDSEWWTDGSAMRGQQVHAAVRMLHTDRTRGYSDNEYGDTLAPFMRAYHRFERESGMVIDASEELHCDPLLGAAGTLDLRGALPPVGPWIDIVDIKTGTIPSHVGYQTAGYARLLPVAMRGRVRRWVLNLRADGTYALRPLTNAADTRVFLAAVIVAQAKKGWFK